MLLAPEMIDTDLHTGWTELRERLQGFVALRVSPANAEDVLQDALLRIQRGLPDLRESDRLGPWIYRVTRSAIADHLRARTRSIERTETCAPEELDGAALSVDEPDTATASLVRCVSTFVAELPSPYREAITLTDLEGLSQKDAADIVGISLSGMKSRVQRGRERLRQMFVQCCELTQDARGRVIECEPRGACAPSEACGSSRTRAS